MLDAAGRIEQRAANTCILLLETYEVGVIHQLVPCADGQIRSAVIRLTGNRLTNRPLKKLYPIETEVTDDLPLKNRSAMMRSGSPVGLVGDDTIVRHRRATKKVARERITGIISTEDAFEE